MMLRVFITFLFLISAMPLWAVTELKEISVKTTDTGASLQFTPSEKVTVQFFYADSFEGINTGLSFVSIEPQDQIEVSLDGLRQGTIYYFQANFYDAKNERKFYRLGWFKTSGRAVTCIEKIDLYPAQYEAKVNLYMNNPGTGFVSLKAGKQDLKFAFVFQNKTTIPGSLGVQQEVNLYTASLSGLKAIQKYNLRILFTDEKGTVLSKDAVLETLENDIALKKPVEGTFTGKYIADNFILDGDILSRVNDGSFDYRSGMAVSSNNPAISDHWVIVDLQKSYPIRSVITFWRSLAYPLAYQVSLSIDKKTWTSLKNVVSPYTDQLAVNLPMKVGETAYKGENARFVKIFIPAGTKCYQRFDNYSFIQLMELKIYPQE